MIATIAWDGPATYECENDCQLLAAIVTLDFSAGAPCYLSLGMNPAQSGQLVYAAAAAASAIGQQQTITVDFNQLQQKIQLRKGDAITVLNASATLFFKP